MFDKGTNKIISYGVSHIDILSIPSHCIPSLSSPRTGHVCSCLSSYIAESTTRWLYASERANNHIRLGGYDKVGSSPIEFFVLIFCKGSRRLSTSCHQFTCWPMLSVGKSEPSLPLAHNIGLAIDGELSTTSSCRINHHRPHWWRGTETIRLILSY